MKKMYLNTNTGEIWTEDEVKEAFEQFGYEAGYECYEEYINKMLQNGRDGKSGLMEIN